LEQSVRLKRDLDASATAAPELRLRCVLPQQYRLMKLRLRALLCYRAGCGLGTFPQDTAAVEAGVKEEQNIRLALANFSPHN
jgi:hypothetical protein